ncbi:MAG: alpha/beta hydrolase [Gammaproteobacteria bacterium]|nr:alpha/beta hydrolase [Gammaproteobacteria bacterium]
MDSIWTALMGGELKQTYYNANGVRTRVLEAGEGMPLIFIHGTGGSAEAYTRNILEHAKHFHVYSIDMVGHGFTDCPELEYNVFDFVKHLSDFIDAIGADRVILSGESLGAFVSTFYALRNPDRVHKLVLNTGMLMPPAGEQGRQEILDALERSRKAAGNLTREAVRKRIEWLMHDPADATDELVELRYRIYSQPGMTDTVAKISESILGGAADPERAKLKLWEKNRDIKCPTLVLWTRHNPGQPADKAEETTRLIPDGRFVLLENSAHWPQWEEADLFNQIHLDFLLG